MERPSIVKISGTEWNERHAVDAYEDVFGKTPVRLRPSDFALVVFYKNEAGGYVQCRELGNGIIRWHMGGVIIEQHGHYLIESAVVLLLEKSFQEYETVTFLVERTNFRMIRLATRVGFRVVGTRVGADGLVYACFEINRDRYQSQHREAA